MKIMTFNTQHCLNYLERRIDFDIMARAITDCGADIVGLNEMLNAKPGSEYGAQVAELAARTGLKHHYFAEAIKTGGIPYGNGFLSRRPIANAETVMIPDPAPRGYDGYYETRCLLKARLECGLTVLVTHFGLNPDEQQNAANTVLQHLEAEKCILMGDFNVQPEDAVLRPIRARMKDTAALFAAPLQSFPSDAPDRKIDYIFVSPDIEVLQADIPPIVASDHRPHTAEIAVPGI